MLGSTVATVRLDCWKACLSCGDDIHDGTIPGRKVRTDKSGEEESKQELTVQRCVLAVGSRGAEIHNRIIPGSRGKAR